MMPAESNSEKSVYTKRRMGAATHAHPSCGMTTTKTVKSVSGDVRQIFWAVHLKRMNQISSESYSNF